MKLNEYQDMAQRTAIYRDKIDSEHWHHYSSLGLVGEAGEVANQVKKIIRDDDGDVSLNRLLKLKDELGDVLWYVACLARDLGLNLDEIAENNLQKLYTRLNEGSIQGDGDNR